MASTSSSSSSTNTTTSGTSNNLQSWYECSGVQTRSIDSSSMTPMPIISSTSQTTSVTSSNIISSTSASAASEQAIAAFGALAALGLKSATSIIASSSSATGSGSASTSSNTSTIDLESGQTNTSINGTSSSGGFGLDGILSSYLSGNSKSSSNPSSSSSSSTTPEWTCGLTATQRFQAFALLACSSISLYFASFFIFLPMLLFAPSKFATAFTFASIMWLLGFAILWGPKSTLTSLIAPDKRAFTLSYIGSLLLTLYAAFVSQSYFLIMLAIAIQLTSAMYYTASYFPGGTMAAGAISRMCIGSVRAMLTSASR